MYVDFQLVFLVDFHPFIVMVHVYLRREVVGNSVQIQQKTQSGPSVNRPVVQDRLHSGESRHQPSSYFHGSHVFPDKFGVQKMGFFQPIQHVPQLLTTLGFLPFPEGERAAFGDQGLKKEWWFSAQVPILLKGESITVERFAYSFFWGCLRKNAVQRLQDELGSCLVSQSTKNAHWIFVKI